MASAVADAGGDTTELAGVTRAVYREWKIQHIDEHLDEVRAHRLRPWRARRGRSGDAGEVGRTTRACAVCADCDDNSLSGVIAAGEPFATGQPCAPRTRGAAACSQPTAGSVTPRAQPLPRAPLGVTQAPRRQRVGDRGRILVIAAIVLIVGLIIFARFFAGFYVDYLWHISLGRGDVFWGILRTKLLLFVLFAGAFSAMAIVNLLIADRLSPVAFSANIHPAVERFHDFFGRRLRLFRIVVAVVIGMLFAAPAIGRWQDWLMFRNAQVVRHQRRAVPPRHRLLPVQAAVHHVPAGLAVRRADLHHAAHHRHLRAQRWHRRPAAAAEGAQQHQGAHRRAARRAGAGQGRPTTGCSATS